MCCGVKVSTDKKVFMSGVASNYYMFNERGVNIQCEKGYIQLLIYRRKGT